MGPAIPLRELPAQAIGDTMNRVLVLRLLYICSAAGRTAKGSAAALNVSDADSNFTNIQANPYGPLSEFNMDVEYRTKDRYRQSAGIAWSWLASLSTGCQAHVREQMQALQRQLEAMERERQEQQARTARSRLYRRRSLEVNSHFPAFFEIQKMCILLHRSNLRN